MKFWKVEANAAYALLGFALLGLLLANTGAAQALDSFRNFDLSLLGSTFTVEGWIHEYGIPAFFFLVGLELKRELTIGELSPIKRSVVPALAATFGVALPALTYLCVVGFGSELATGWAVPTATDVTFALAAFTVAGKALPQSARSFLLGYAVIDDLIAVLIIATLFSAPPQPVQFALWLVTTAAFVGIANTKWLLRLRWTRPVLLMLIGIAAVHFTITSGLQPTLTAVVLGLAIPSLQTQRLQDAIHPFVSFTVMPLFALFACGVTFGAANLVASAAFWAVLIRPIGKLIGITLGAELGKKLIGGMPELPLKAVLPTALLGGAGFTVALLVAKYAFTLNPEAEMAAVAATFIASAASLLAAAWLMKRYRTK